MKDTQVLSTLGTLILTVKNVSYVHKHVHAWIRIITAELRLGTFFHLLFAEAAWSYR